MKCSICRVWIDVTELVAGWFPVGLKPGETTFCDGRVGRNQRVGHGLRNAILPVGCDISMHVSPLKHFGAGQIFDFQPGNKGRAAPCLDLEK